MDARASLSLSADLQGYSQEGTSLSLPLLVFRLIFSRSITCGTAWKVAPDWKEGTGNGHGQRIIDNAPDSANEDAEADVMGAHSSSCSGRYSSLL